ncbi:Malonyl-coenzyme:anthocyanin 5-O-glucoside-6'''-O-malonyltransferase, partial [Dichanthelium oligosanthes]
LSFFDTQWVVFPPIQRVFLYELPGAGGDDDDEFPAAVRRLKDSLAATLALYIPLAGKLAYVSETGDVVVDCAGDPGVAFIEAEAADGSGMDVRGLATDEAHDIRAFQALVPPLDTRVLPAPVLSVQATRLPGRGLALGLSKHHAVADGQAVWRFMGAWAAAAREGSPVTKTLGAPHYDREVVQIPNGDEFARDMLRNVAPNLPVVRTPYPTYLSSISFCIVFFSSLFVTKMAAGFDFSKPFRLARRTFYLADDDIRALKRRIDALAAAEEEKDAGSNATAGTSKKKPVSTFVAVAALGWTAFVRAKGLAAGADTYLVFVADLRARLDPPVADGYLGNCIKGCLATADAGD